MFMDIKVARVYYLLVPLTAATSHLSILCVLDLPSVVLFRQSWFSAAETSTESDVALVFRLYYIDCGRFEDAEKLQLSVEDEKGQVDEESRVSTERTLLPSSLLGQRHFQ